MAARRQPSKVPTVSPGQSFIQAISSILCCYSPHHESRGPEPATLRTLHPTSASAVSLALPTTAVPHSAAADGTFSDADTEALREMFGSSSSVRGYQAAVSPMAMKMDSGTAFPFQIDSQECQVVPPYKPTGRIEQLGHHIRQKLSESRISKKSMENKDDSSPLKQTGTNSEKPEEHALLLGASHRSTGFTDLLMSRTASEGGYDSDAKSIETGMLKSNTGTILVGSSFARDALKTVESANADEQSQISNSMAELQQNKERNAADRGRPRSSQRGRLLPDASFTEALRFGRDESPSDVFRRLNEGIASGTIKPPNTPELKAMKLPTLNDARDSWRLSIKAPRRGSSLNRSSIEARDGLRSPGEKIEKVKRESLVEQNEDDKHLSLVSNLDPRLLEYICKFGDNGSDDHNLDDLCQAQEERSQESGISVPPPPTAHRETLSSLDSEGTSVHLFNMRISQRLASTSQVPVLSASNSNLGSLGSQSIHSDSINTDEPSLNISRFPSWIAHERNRKPSDPQTRRLFEGEKEDRKQPPKWKTFTSVHTSTSSFNNQPPTRDDSSSIYTNEVGPRVSGAGSSLNLTRGPSIKNPNSLAVGGRAASGILLSMAQPSKNEESVWFHRTASNGRKTSENRLLSNGKMMIRRRSVSVPKESRFVEEITTQTPTGKSRRVYLRSTEANEGMSEISMEGIREGRDESLSNINVAAVRDARNENFSDEPNPCPFLLYSDHGNRSARPNSLKSGSGSEGDTLEVVEVHDKSRVQESATNVWERTFKRVKDEDLMGSSHHSFGGMLRPAHYDRKGRPKSSRRHSSISVQQSHRDDRARSPGFSPSTPPRRSQSESGREKLVCNEHSGPYTLSHRPFGQSPREGVQGRDETRKRRLRAPKKSLVDLKKHSSDGDTYAKAKPSTSPTRTGSFRGMLGAWGKFPSHTREERCGAAREKDGVKPRDFALRPDEEEAAEELCNPFDLTSATSKKLFNPGSTWRLLTLRGKNRNGRRKSKSMLTLDRTKTSTLRSKSHPSRGRIGNGRSPWSIQKLYRSHSSDFRNHVRTYGHRSSVSFGRSVEHPELEMLPGQGLGGEAWKKEREAMQVREQLRTDEDEKIKGHRSVAAGFDGASAQGNIRDRQDGYGGDQVDDQLDAMENECSSNYSDKASPRSSKSGQNGEKMSLNDGC